ncbi:LysR family transcriptional regulator [Marinobacter qingdaonensis]|uniref:LysR family transcriptional regulator n=1 Tax=Marinobacter qingdaonensis TaxID=3108486 RepID=A0ABU5NTM8_9GAMM|nr:LysR family transcriptional regulator [Marinobacter sp. ASW11-75]MEA1079138.1 LysR family transcriptional regulator [Marinobacter sp. ASW11-75]
MNVRHIELFQAILQTGTLTAAAELLNISQPAASKMLQHAEQQLGFSLFDRVRGKLQATAEARILQQKTESLFFDLQSLRRLAQSLRRGEESSLRLVCTPALAQDVLPAAICKWREAYPHVHCELATQHTSEIIQALLLREADIGLTLQHVEHSGLQTECLCLGGIRVIAPPGWWSEEDLRQSVNLQYLADKPLIGIDAQDGLGGLLRTHIQDLSPRPKINTWVQTYQLAKGLVEVGQGLALVDPLTAAQTGAGGKVQARCIEPRLTVPLYLLFRIGERTSLAGKALIQSIREYAKELFDD